MGYTTVDLSPHITVQLDLSKLTSVQLAEIADAGNVLATHSLFETDARVRCPNCVQDNRCSDFNNAIATYDRFQIVPKRSRRIALAIDLRSGGSTEGEGLAE
jgi:hypothetical protein